MCVEGTACAEAAEVCNWTVADALFGVIFERLRQRYGVALEPRIIQKVSVHKACSIEPALNSVHGWILVAIFR